MTQFQTIVSGFMQHIESISSEVEKEKLKVCKLFECCLFVRIYRCTSRFHFGLRCVL